MKKGFARVLSAVMAAAMLAGCGAKDTDGGASSGANGGAGKADGTIKVGTCGPLTGDNAVYGNAVAHGLELAFEEINALGGLQFSLNSQDDQGDPGKGVNAYNTLMDWGMQVMAGPTTSGVSTAVAAECASDGVFMLTPSGSDPSIITTGDNIFQICFTDPNQGIASAEYIKEHSLGAKIGIIYDSSSAYSTGIYEKFMAETAQQGLTVVAEEAFNNDNKTDLSTQVTKCQSAGCDLVFMPIYQAEAAQILTYANKIGYTPKFFGCDGLDGVLTVENFDTKLAEGVMLLTPFDATSADEATQNFVKKYTEKYGDSPNQFAADAYDVGYAIYEACKAANVTADMGYKDVCKAMVEQFTAMEFNGLTGKNMTWGQDGAVSKLPMAVKIENGVYVGMK